MIAHDDDHGVFVEILLFAPLDEIGGLPVRAFHNGGQGNGILAFLTQTAQIAVREMGINGEHCQVKRLAGLGKPQQLFLGNIIQYGVLKTPPDVIVTGKPACGNSSFVIINIVVAVAGEIGAPSAEAGVGAAEKFLCVAFFLQNVAECLQIRRETGADAYL